MEMDFVIQCVYFIALLMAMRHCSCQENVALGKPAEQCSNFSSFTANLAVDGNTDVKIYHGSCSHTNDATNSWWKVDLPGYFSISSVKIFNRDELSCAEGNCAVRLQKFEIRVTFLNPVSFPSSEGQLCQFRNEIVPVGGFVMNCSQPITGRYVSIFKAANNALSLCEVEVYPVKTKAGAVYENISSNTRCDSTIVMSTTARSTLHCATMCQRESQCGAFNVQRLPGNQNIWSCELLSLSYVRFTDHALQYIEGWQCYYCLH